MVKCGRCKKEIEILDAESCWYCNDWLCYDCWDEFGHCGHTEADEINEQARNWSLFGTIGESKK